MTRAPCTVATNLFLLLLIYILTNRPDRILRVKSVDVDVDVDADVDVDVDVRIIKYD